MIEIDHDEARRPIGIGPRKRPVECSRPLFSVVVPVFNEARTLAELCRRLDTVIRAEGGAWEVVVVNDGSIDGSLETLLDLRQHHPYLRVVDLSRNFGHQPALAAGIEYASGDAIVLMDGDLQDVPEAIPAFIAKWREGFEVVYAVREKRKEPWPKRMAFEAFYRLQTRLSRIETPLHAGIFSLLDRRVVDALTAMPERNRYLPGLRAYSGFTQAGVRVERAPRLDGTPRVTLRGLIRLALDGIFGFSTFPLRLVFVSGAVLASLSFLIAVTGLYFRYVRGVQMFSWAFGLSTSFFFGGIQLMSIGIIGEYVGRIYDEVKRRPYYVARRLYGFDSGPGPDEGGAARPDPRPTRARSTADEHT